MADTTISISPQDVAVAANFLEQFLSDEVPSGDFTPGTALRDLSIGALATIYAFLQAENTQVKQMQSLQSVSAAVGGDPTALRDAVIAILSNFFISPKAGSKSRGLAIAHISQQVDIFIQSTHRFTRAPGLIFVADIPSDQTVLFIPQSDLVPVFDASNAIIEYQFRIPLVAVRTGSEFDIDPGLFADFDRFNPFVTRIENIDKFDGGNPPETVDAILTRAPTAISVRNLINSRSIAAVLEDTFPDIKSLFTAGMGDVEMQRDVIRPASHLALHVGGAVDIYPQLDLVETTVTGVVGNLFARPDELVVMFRDPTVPDFVAAGVEVGDIIRVVDGLPSVPREFRVEVVRPGELAVSERAPFPLATEEQSPAGALSYTIGRVPPTFTDIVSDIGGTPKTTGISSRRVQHTGRITLPGGPVMEIIDVAVINPPPAEAAFKSPVDGFVHFPNHVNGTPSNLPTPTQGLQFETIINNPDEAQSEHMWMEVVVGTDTNPTRFDGATLRVRYRTLAAFADIDAFVTSRRARTVCASQLVRGHNPVTLRTQIKYRLSPEATSLLDDSVIAQTVVDFINAFDTSEVPIDVSAISDKVRETFPTISAVSPIVIDYDLLAPTGEVLTYETVDLVNVDPTKQVAGPVLDLGSFGVTPRTVRYLADTDGVTAEQIT